MRKIILLISLAVLAWKGYERYSVTTEKMANAHELAPEADTAVAKASISNIRLNNNASFRCDGRTYCSQMNSCEEATYFLQHCPDVKMDGDNDGVPCEKQWCSPVFAK